MEVVVRKEDGYVLNSTAFNYDWEYNQQLSEGIDYSIYGQEHYDVYDLDLNPLTNEAIDGFLKQYFYIDGELICKYSATDRVDVLIKQYETELASTDYIIVKAYESNLLGENPSTQYNYQEVAIKRQELRDNINRLRQLKMDNPTIVTYKPELMKPIKEISDDKE